MLADVLSAFNNATGLRATDFAGVIIMLTAGLGGTLGIAWMFRAGREALQGGWGHMPIALLTVVAAFIFLIVVLRVLYE